MGQIHPLAEVSIIPPLVTIPMIVLVKNHARIHTPHHYIVVPVIPRILDIMRVQGRKPCSLPGCRGMRSASFRQGHGFSEFDAEVEKEYGAAGVRKSLATSSLGY